MCCCQHSTGGALVQRQKAQVLASCLNLSISWDAILDGKGLSFPQSEGLSPGTSDSRIPTLGHSISGSWVFLEEPMAGTLIPSFMEEYTPSSLPASAWGPWPPSGSSF